MVIQKKKKKGKRGVFLKEKKKKKKKKFNNTPPFFYPSTPETIRTLFRQRLRWIYGFINNTLDYRRTILRKRYGNFALFTLPTGLVSLFAVGYIFSKFAYETGNFIYSKFIEIDTIGLEASSALNSFDPFFLNAKMSLFLVVFIYSGIFFAILFGRKMAEGRWKVSLNMVYFFLLFRLVAPFWILNAIWNTLRSRAPSWR